MIEFNNELYIIGSFDSIGGTPAINIAKWDGNDWFDVGGGLPNHPPMDPGGLFCLVESNGNLYTAGSYFGIHKWDGSSWSIIGNVDGFVFDMIEYQGEVIVTGTFTEINNITVNGLAKWDGQNWASFGSGLAFSGQPSGTGYCLETLNNELYVGRIYTC